MEHLQTRKGSPDVWFTIHGEPTRAGEWSCVLRFFGLDPEGPPKTRTNPAAEFPLTVNAASREQAVVVCGDLAYDYIENGTEPR